jgi:hypothetical protein
MTKVNAGKDIAKFFTMIGIIPTLIGITLLVINHRKHGEA